MKINIMNEPCIDLFQINVYKRSLEKNVGSIRTIHKNELINHT